METKKMEMMSLCAWCPGADVWTKSLLAAGVRVTHGMCPSCAAAARAELVGLEKETKMVEQEFKRVQLQTRVVLTRNTNGRVDVAVAVAVDDMGNCKWVERTVRTNISLSHARQIEKRWHDSFVSDTTRQAVVFDGHDLW